MMTMYDDPISLAAELELGDWDFDPEEKAAIKKAALGRRARLAAARANVEPMVDSLEHQASRT